MRKSYMTLTERSIQVFLVAIGLLVLSSLVGCSMVNESIASRDIDEDGIPEETVVNTANMTPSGYKFMKRADLVEKLCVKAQDNYDKYLVLSTFSVTQTPIVIVNGAYVPIPEGSGSTVSNIVNRPDAGPFDMVGCIEHGMKTGVERLLSQTIAGVVDITKTVIPFGAGYFVADRVVDALEKPDIEVDGDGNTVGLTDGGVVDQRSDQAGDDSVYSNGSCVGEIIDGQCVLPQADPEEDPEEDPDEDPEEEPEEDPEEEPEEEP